ncbi:origin recognition complex subunit 3 N-terminus-domain-containing protein [Daedaleopsis nitida]|nr:origin recognition complex subunit 3 N-terminus-domain-containing protein [Daedaleopsis nitida]
MKELDDPSTACIYIPPGQPEDDNEDAMHGQESPDEQGYERRMEEYKAAWMKCLDRVRGILQALNAPVVHNVVTEVVGAYDDILPGLPYPELPVVALCSANSALVGNIARELEDPANEQLEDSTNHTVLHVHLYPAECSNVMNMMKAIVTGFVDRQSGVKRKPTSLASFDINLLRAWYAAQDSQPRLSIFLHEFEKFDPKVVQDVFHICSLHVSNLPIVFVLIMASPPAPSFLHSAYPRSTLALLRVHQVVAPTGLATVKEVLTKTFFDPDFEPDLVLGHGVLEYITDFAARHTASPDALLTMLQLSHLKHFTNTLSVFVRTEALGLAPEDVLASPLADAIHTRLLAAQSPNHVDDRPQNASGLLDAVSEARTAFRKHARRMRVAFAVARIAERVALGDASGPPVTGMGASGSNTRLDSMESLSAVLRGRTRSQVRYACMAVKKLPAVKLRALLQALHGLFYGLQNADVRSEEEDARMWIIESLNQLPEVAVEEGTQIGDELPLQDAETKELAANVGNWLQEYIEARLIRFEDCALWDIWYTGASPMPSELINPAARPAVVAALLHPHDFVCSYAELARIQDPAHAPERQVEEDGPDARELALWELPDTSIAFRRYIEAGRMVNVFDWFESFAVVLESQRKHLKRRAAKGVADTAGIDGKSKGKQKAKGTPRTPRKNGRARPANDDDDDIKEAATDEDEMDVDEEMDEEEEEAWKVEVQARFMRALHELDYMGFVKHTGRKADHIIRTVYDVPD